MLPLKLTVPLLLPNVPPVCDQVPDTFKVVDGAVKVPVDKMILVAVTVPVDPLNVPPLTVKPPLKLCVALEA